MDRASPPRVAEVLAAATGDSVARYEYDGEIPDLNALEIVPVPECDGED